MFMFGFMKKYRCEKRLKAIIYPKKEGTIF